MPPPARRAAKTSLINFPVSFSCEAIMVRQRVGVVGAGTMGNWIAHVFARSGFSVVLCDVEQRFLDGGLDTIAKNLDREVAKNKITVGDKVSTLVRITAVLGRAEPAELRLVFRGGEGKLLSQCGNF